MTSLSEAAAVKTVAAKRNRSEWETVADVTVPVWKARSGSGKLGTKKA